MIKIRALCLATALLAGSPSAALAQNADDTAVGSHLPPKIRALLIQEMNAILAASQQILGALVRGEDDLVAQQAQAIHDSFILAQEMTEADHHALHEALPPAFLEKDQAFHHLSAQLAAAARAGNQPRQRALFNDMLDACVVCHAQHATDRFPDLTAPAGAGQ